MLNDALIDDDVLADGSGLAGDDAPADDAAEKAKALAKQAALWVDAQMAGVCRAFEVYRDKRSPGGVSTLKDFLLRDGVDVAAVASTVIEGVLVAFRKESSLTAAGVDTGKALAGLVGARMSKSDHLKIGVQALDVVAGATGAYRIEVEQADRPMKVKGGVKMALSYKLAPAKASILTALIEAGKVGTPTVVIGGATPWASLKEGGIATQTGGMIHGNQKRLGPITPETAPELYRAVNIAQAMRYRTNGDAMAVVEKHDVAKAKAWLLDKFTAKGMDLEVAKRKVAGLCRL